LKQNNPSAAIPKMDIGGVLRFQVRAILSPAKTNLEVTKDRVPSGGDLEPVGFDPLFVQATILSGPGSVKNRGKISARDQAGSTLRGDRFFALIDSFGLL
jgi:hypothetical protein